MAALPVKREKEREREREREREKEGVNLFWICKLHLEGKIKEEAHKWQRARGETNSPPFGSAMAPLKSLPIRLRLTVSFEFGNSGSCFVAVSL